MIITKIIFHIKWRRAISVRQAIELTTEQRSRALSYAFIGIEFENSVAITIKLLSKLLFYSINSSASSSSVRPFFLALSLILSIIFPSSSIVLSVGKMIISNIFFEIFFRKRYRHFSVICSNIFS